MDRVQVEGVSKRYTLGEQRNFRETLTALATRRRAESRELWSLRDVSFTLADGEALGIVGRNGAGKSTLLKVLMRITTPTLGRSRTRGRVAALLEVGTGFHPELTGRENVYLNAAVLGMSRAETTRRFDEIVDFAGTERFLDTPVKRYSSGMYLRLAFAVAAHLEPDVLIVDEVLAVGDAEFQRKCLRRMSTAEAEGRTVLFVSHDLGALARLCPRALWLEGGRVRDEGPTNTIVRSYLTSGLGGATASVLQGGSAAGRILEVQVRPVDGAERPLFREDPFRVVVCFEVLEERIGLDIAVSVTNDRGVQVFDETLSHTQQHRFPVGRYEVELSVPPILAHGDYTVGVWLGTPHDDLHHEPAALAFTLHGEEAVRRDRTVVLDLPFRVRSLG
ncbi:ABC-2 type transport system ATP-binding protein [Geodermatophilus saharensis]|uniref:ABC-2 type transport system ATP-binding protein n=1 Tax=Geodermatophilus saharensis TaxID=1137994 RepID=A0A239I889_9ACTN|nr:ABC transporter ATP-binding protein [Geodermatophilus saharensis]SNS90076.1 ABC-2 type transport system ATP-binding protein [Geodermatophilus saharensis]